MSDLMVETLCIVLLILAPFALIWWAQRKGKKGKDINAKRPEDETRTDR